MMQPRTFKAHYNIQLTDYMINHNRLLFIHLICYVVLCINKAKLTECCMQILTVYMHMRWACEPQHIIPYTYSGKGESLANHPWFAKLKPSKLVLTINNLLADLLICQTFFRQMLKESIHQTFPPPNFHAIR